MKCYIGKIVFVTVSPKFQRVYYSLSTGRLMNQIVWHIENFARMNLVLYLRAAAQQNQQNDMCTQRTLRSV